MKSAYQQYGQPPGRMSVRAVCAMTRRRYLRRAIKPVTGRLWQSRLALTLFGLITEQLKALLEEKQHLQTRIDAAKKEAANRINEDSRMAELAAYLEEHLSGFQQYDDGIVRKMIERVTVVDEETIRVKCRYSDLEIEQTVR